MFGFQENRGKQRKKKVLRFKLRSGITPGMAVENARLRLRKLLNFIPFLIVSHIFSETK
jgi:hypothetical protein